MPLSYGLRLLCLCAATFYLLHALLGGTLALMGPQLLRRLEPLAPRQGARILFILRMLPGGLALLAVLGLCIPSYLWLEPANDGERMGVLIVLPALLGLVVWSLALVRVARASLAARRYARTCRRQGRAGRLRGESMPVLVLGGPAPVVALSGLIHPRLIISRSVLRTLSAGQLKLAISHEQAHRAARDNWRRFCLLLAPDLLPGWSAMDGLDRAWVRCTEWAADDQAAGGDPRRCLALAAALVRVARLGARPAPVRLATSLLSGADLSDRIERLVNPRPATGTAGWLVLGPRMAAVSALLLAAAVALPISQHFVHQVLEMLAH